jgi:ubiquinone/menaquinone biosynthesis C-methylase UbiE
MSSNIPTRIRKILNNEFNTKRREWISTRQYFEPVLDIGAAEGFMTAAIPVTDITAFDISKPDSYGYDIPFVVGSVYELPFNDNEFGTVTAFEVLEHLEDPCLALAEIKRVCNNRAYITVPAFDCLTETKGHVQNFTDISVLAQEAGFKIIAYEIDEPFAYLEAEV